MSNKELTVLTLVTKSYITLLHDYFLTTLPAEIEKMKILYVNDFDNCRYNSVAKFLEKKRLEMIYKEIKANMGNNLIFIDADVLFASKTKFQDEINEILENYDLAFQFNDDWYNFGVFAISCNERTESLFKHFLEKEIHKVFDEADLHDQHLINGLLGLCPANVGIEYEVEKTFDNVTHCSLPIKYFANHFTQYQYPHDVPSDIVLLHATNTYNMEEKLNLMSHFKHHYYDLGIQHESSKAIV